MAERMRVLYVDDDSEFLTLTVEELEQANEAFDVSTAENATLARKTLDSTDVECIVCDYKMPGQDGLDFLSDIRDEYPSLPFILYTGKGSEEVASEAFSAGATEYVQKDSSTSQYTVLANRIENAVAQYRAEKRSERARRRRKQMLDRFFDGYFAFDESLDVQEVNESAASFLGLSRDEILGANYTEVLDADSVYEACKEALANDEPQRVEKVAGFKQGHWVEARMFPVGDGLTVYFRDVTAQAEYEHALERQNERLEQCTRIVSHDLRNPLNVAQLRVTLLQDESDSPHLDAIERAHDRMETIVDETLILARQDETMIQKERVNVETAAQNSWEEVPTADATLVIEDPPVVTADPDRLQHVFENLYRNAVTHAGETVCLEVDSCKEGFYVADDGPGIPDKIADTLFEFGVTSDEDGTGYGLAIVEEVIDAHDWNIEVAESESGGARFEVTGIE
jgi:PAS domain S-box-containing protein